MGDARRFDEFAGLIARNFPDRSTHIADVAGGKGGLKAALYQKGYKNVDIWDRRPRNIKKRRGMKYGLFDYKSAPRKYGLVVGMHPDGGTDQIIHYATRQKVPFVVCPCCAIPSVGPFYGEPHQWFDHIAQLAKRGGMKVFETVLPIKGKNRVLVGRP